MRCASLGRRATHVVGLPAEDRILGGSRVKGGPHLGLYPRWDSWPTSAISNQETSTGRRTMVSTWSLKKGKTWRQKFEEHHPNLASPPISGQHAPAQLADIPQRLGSVAIEVASNVSLHSASERIPGAAEKRRELPARMAVIVKVADDRDRRLSFLQFETRHVDSEMWTPAIHRSKECVGRLPRGDYAFRLGLIDSAGRTIRMSAEQESAARRLRSVEHCLEEDDRKRTLDVVHSNVDTAGLLCTPCRTPDIPVLDLDQLGYPKRSQAVLTDSVIIRQLLQIESGRPFYLPGFVQHGPQR